MIQSVKFDSLNMDIKKIANTVFTFVIKRLIEKINLKHNSPEILVNFVF